MEPLKDGASHQTKRRVPFMPILFVLILSFSLQAHASVPTNPTCAELGLTAGQEIDLVAVVIKDWKTMPALLKDGQLSKIKVTQLRFSRGLEWILENIEDSPKIDLQDDLQFVNAVIKTTGHFSQPLFRQVLIGGQKYDEVETGHGGGDWTESSFFIADSTQITIFSTQDKVCQDLR